MVALHYRAAFMSIPRGASLVIEAFEPSGGAFWESTALRNALAHADVTMPQSRRVMSEAMCFGLMGGIAAGYSVAPARIARGAGSRIEITGRAGALDPGPGQIRVALRGLGARVKIAETSGRQAAARNLERALAADHPAFVWCAPPRMLGQGWANTFGTCVLLVYGIDGKRGAALIGDRSRRPVSIPLRELSALRASVHAHRRRILTFDPPARLGSAALRNAVIDSIRACATGMLRPKVRAAGLPGLLEWARVFADPGHRRGWPRLYRDGRVYVALRDVYDSIETAGTGGSLFRPLYASFLKEAAVVARKPSLLRSARAYRALGVQWSDLANTTLPVRIPAFRRTRALLAQRRRLIAAGGPLLAERMARVQAGLDAIEARMRHRFPLDRIEVMGLLTSMREQILHLHGAEERAARQLLDAIRNSA